MQASVIILYWRGFKPRTSRLVIKVMNGLQKRRMWSTFCCQNQIQRSKDLNHQKGPTKTLALFFVSPDTIRESRNEFLKCLHFNLRTQVSCGHSIIIKTIGRWVLIHQTLVNITYFKLIPSRLKLGILERSSNHVGESKELLSMATFLEIS